MADLAPRTPDDEPRPGDRPAGREGPNPKAPQPPRYDANLRLIQRRLVDEKRTARPRRWWLPGF